MWANAPEWDLGMVGLAGLVALEKGDSHGALGLNCEAVGMQVTPAFACGNGGTGPF